MKKKLLVLLLSLCCLFVSMGGSACGSNTNNNRKPVSAPTLLAPYVMTLGDVLSWETVTGATEYQIYCNGQVIGKTEKTQYVLGSRTQDESFYIVASNGRKNSEKSNEVIAWKNTNFSQEEILDLSDKSSFQFNISQSIKKVIVKKETATDFYWAGLIEERESDILFELKNVTLNGSIKTVDGKYDRATHNYSVIFLVEGTCVLRADAGLNGNNYSGDSWTNSEMDGGDGKDGKVALTVSTAIFKGNGSLQIYGGNGGNGGDGASTSTWEAVNGPGAGSNGGNGGAAIKSSYFVLQMDTMGWISYTDGSGGRKGEPGENNSIITGPGASLMWNDMYDIGKNGSSGSSSLGKRIIIQGNLK